MWVRLIIGMNIGWIMKRCTGVKESNEYLFEVELLLLDFVTHHHSMKMKNIPLEMIQKAHEKLLLQAKELRH
uniref:Uncharacterized protein n=1 Tax=Tanacetum cinerariifolium TaxID=118510 RepID=A0A699WI10_TANCI|nr:hypothetical protein [Tanacetum cinerariifolium]